MLKSLIIKNIVLVEKLKLNYNTNFSVFSGETGAGKSIILSSLGLAIGMRADFSLIRKGESEGVVIAEFQINKEHLAYKKIINHGLNAGNDLILRRVLSRDGVSKAFVNDNLVTANFLKELGNPYDISLSDTDGTKSIIFGVFGVPESILINKERIIVKKFIGPLNINDYDDILKLVNEK